MPYLQVIAKHHAEETTDKLLSSVQFGAADLDELCEVLSTAAGLLQAILKRRALARGQRLTQADAEWCEVLRTAEVKSQAYVVELFKVGNIGTQDSSEKGFLIVQEE